MIVARIAWAAVLLAACAACGGGTIDECAAFRAREQIPERHCPPRGPAHAAHEQEPAP